MDGSSRDLEAIEQQITATLQAIDGDFVRAAEIAASMLPVVKQFATHTKASHAGLKVNRLRACPSLWHWVLPGIVPYLAC